MKVRDSLRYCAGVFDGEECNACDYEGCTTELMLDAAHSIDHLLAETLALRAVEELISDIEK